MTVARSSSALPPRCVALCCNNITVLLPYISVLVFNTATLLTQPAYRIAHTTRSH